MLEDQLTRDERIRLEALAQANVLNNSDIVIRTSFLVIEMAQEFEKYIRGDEDS